MQLVLQVQKSKKRGTMSLNSCPGL